MIFMFTTSCVYLALSPIIKGKKVMRIIDHCDIYIFIAGCYLIGAKKDIYILYFMYLYY